MRAIIDHSEAASKLLAARDKQLSPLSHGAIVLDRAIITPHIGRSFEDLHPAPGFQRLESLAEQMVPIDDTACEITHVDVVDAVGVKGPVLTTVFDVATRLVSDGFVCRQCPFTYNLQFGGTQDG